MLASSTRFRRCLEGCKAMSLASDRAPSNDTHVGDYARCRNQRFAKCVRWGTPTASGSPRKLALANSTESISGSQERTIGVITSTARDGRFSGPLRFVPGAPDLTVMGAATHVGGRHRTRPPERAVRSPRISHDGAGRPTQPPIGHYPSRSIPMMGNSVTTVEMLDQQRFGAIMGV